MKDGVQESLGFSGGRDELDASATMHSVSGPTEDVIAEVEMLEDSKVPAPIEFARRHTTAGQDVFDSVKWERRDAVIKEADGSDIFRQENMEFPVFYSQTATNVIAAKYFSGNLGVPDRENSVRDMISRVVDTITKWATEGGYFPDSQSAQAFRDELAWLILHQHGTFNSPVWFNVGVEEHPQCSACFINAVEDTMESILELAKTEGLLFKYGSGSGTNFSPLRSSRESLRGGGVPSGPVSFMRGYDAFAGVIKSGGKTRRAAKMVIMNAEHPDIVEFIESKVKEEKKAHALIAAGYDGSFGGEAYESIAFQNANNSVRATDAFMMAIENDDTWDTRAVTNGEVIETFKARDILQKISEAAHACGDPGFQFDTTVNEWHTCPQSGRINASNPCSEFMFLDNSACNLASLNLMRFVDESGDFKVEDFKHAVGTFILAQEAIVSRAAYPTELIRSNSERFRPLGLGYANLGALLMNWGLPYDSDEGRAVSAAITALMTGSAYVMSAKMAARVGSFEDYAKNRVDMMRVMRKHRVAIGKIQQKFVPADIVSAAVVEWDEAIRLGELHGYRNSQTTLLAPTGTIGFKMDCDTTGIEPELAIVKYKKLVGGGTMKIVNGTIPSALRKLGYEEARVREITQFIDSNDTIEGAPGLKENHLTVFDCAFKASKGTRFIDVMGHIKMMGAVQPFLSGAISKTVNMPSDTTVDDVARTYVEAWRLGLKAVAIYRDGSKGVQPVMTSKDQKKEIAKLPVEIRTVFQPYRKRLPDERASITHKFTIGGMDGYITVGMYEEGNPGEIFVTMAKQGSVISGLMDSFATSISIALQYGVPLRVLVDKFAHVRFEPAGFSTNPAIGYAKSIVDYVFRWLEYKFLREDAVVRGAEPVEAPKAAPATDIEAKEEPLPAGPAQEDLFQGQEDAPPCSECGFIMVRSGACYKCQNCGATSGCS